MVSSGAQTQDHPWWGGGGELNDFKSATLKPHNHRGGDYYERQ